MELSPADQRALLGIARAAIERQLRDAPAGPPPAEGSAELDGRRGVFVTLRAQDPRGAGRLKLRGCIGTLETVRPLRESVPLYAVKAAFEDPRFPSLTSVELDGLRIEITVLGAPRPIADPEEIEVGIHGVQLDVPPRRAVFLPQVAVEQRWDVDRLLEELARKSGLPRDGWRAGLLSTFEGFSFGEGA